MAALVISCSPRRNAGAVAERSVSLEPFSGRRRALSVISKDPPTPDGVSHDSCSHRWDLCADVKYVNDLRRIRSVSGSTALDLTAVNFGWVGREEGCRRLGIRSNRRRRDQACGGPIGTEGHDAIKDTRESFLPFSFDSGIRHGEFSGPGVCRNFENQAIALLGPA
jgi:hypothetical protein